MYYYFWMEISHLPWIFVWEPHVALELQFADHWPVSHCNCSSIIVIVRYCLLKSFLQYYSLLSFITAFCLLIRLSIQDCTFISTTTIVYPRLRFYINDYTYTLFYPRCLLSIMTVHRPLYLFISFYCSLLSHISVCFPLLRFDRKHS